MKIVGIIVEYNPLHNGHIHHIEETRRLSNADVLIAVMSSNVVQRGEFSMIDKFTRTRWALKAGIDMVVELPGIFALQSADLFAYTSVSLLNHLGVNEIYFGSETGDTMPLYELVDIMNTSEYSDLLKHYLNEGKSFPTSSDLALNELGHQALLKHPNNILGLQYINAINALKAPIKAHAIRRIDSGYYDDILEGTTIQSATSIRKCLIEGVNIKNYVPSYVYEDLKSYKPFDLERFYPYIDYLTRVLTREDLHNVFGFEEGLENRYLSIEKFESVEDYINQVISPRYTHAKIKRTLMHMLIQTKKDVLTDFNPPYIRILGMNTVGQNYVNKIKKDVSIPLITKLKQTRHPYLDLELRITTLIDIPLNKNLLKEEFKPVLII
ncbi:nucleotidyltransferase [Liberiplasma polymorphum]|uniref:nucleotidyltransferase n=1 Tax=Liberiplasma polymorphum TaxID=3374570 RepID=UPI003773C7BC